MKLRPSLDEARIAEGFTPQNDIFHLADLSKRLTALVRALSQGSVSILDGRWGTGKTTFVKMWVAQLEREGMPAIYFDAFKADYIQDPFQAISSTFIKAAVARKKTGEPAYQRYLSRTVSAAKRIAGVTTKAGVKLATLGALGAAEIDALAELADDISSSAGDISEQAIKSLLEEHASDEERFEALRESLKELPTLLAPPAESRNEGASDQRQLIVVIDELDRCRPDFALGIVEVLKHFFRVQGIHFVLVTNISHLSLSVSQRYGLSSHSEEYLQKFYDFVIHFEQRYGEHDTGNVGVYIDHLFNDLLPSSIPTQVQRELNNYTREISFAYGLSLRQIEAMVTNIIISFLAARPREFCPLLIVCILCVLKAVRPNIFVSAKVGRFDYPGFSKFIEEGQWNRIDTGRILSVFRYYSDPEIDENDDEFASFRGALWEYNLGRLDVLPFLANSIIDRFGKI